MPKVTLIDIGSNTVKMNVYRLKAGHSAYKKIIPVKLAAYKKDGELSRVGIDALVATLQDFKREAQGNIYPFATASLRGISNADAVVAEVFEKTGLRIDIISGEDEARYDLFALSKSEKHTSGLLMDMGGGSTELVSFEEKEPLQLNSFPFGALSLKCMLDIPDIPCEEDRIRIKTYLKDQIVRSAFGSGTYPHAVLIGGTAKGMFSLYNAKNQDAVRKNELHPEEIEDLYICLTDGGRFDLAKEVTPERADTILTGIAAYLALFELLGVRRVSLCRRGVRDGYLEKVRRIEEEKKTL